MGWNKAVDTSLGIDKKPGIKHITPGRCSVYQQTAFHANRPF